MAAPMGHMGYAYAFRTLVFDVIWMHVTHGKQGKELELQP
jgi:hypothetical protein